MGALARLVVWMRLSVSRRFSACSSSRSATYVAFGTAPMALRKSETQTEHM